MLYCSPVFLTKTPMLLFREIFIAKPGMASKLAKMMKEMNRGRVMTDMIGTYNTVVVEYEAESLAAFEEEMKKMMAEGPKEQPPEGQRHTDMYLEGRREVFRIL